MEYTDYIKQIKEKYVSGGFSSLSEAERCDLLLSYAAPKKDLRASSERLISECGGCGALFRYAHRSFLSEYARNSRRSFRESSQKAELARSP